MTTHEQKQILFSHLSTLVKIFVMVQILLSTLRINPTPENVGILMENTRRVRNLEVELEKMIDTGGISTERDLNFKFWSGTSGFRRFVEASVAGDYKPGEEL